MPIIKVGMDISGLKSGASQAASVLKGVSSSAADAAKNTGILAASLTKVAAQVLALVGAYKALDSIKFFAQRGLEFNKTTEKTQTSITAMVASMAQLENEQGKLLTGAEKYAAAQNISADMMKEIQRLALSSAVPVEQLIAQMQDVTASALQYGVKLKEIPRFTAAAAEAMQKMGVPVTQMRAEMDALLSGKIGKSKNLAQFLEIDQKTVDAWKNQGSYIDNVAKKLESIGGGPKTLEEATNNLKSAINILSGQTTEGLNESLKESISTLKNLFTVSKDGTDAISDDFANVAVVIEQAQSSIGDTILSLTQTFTAAVRGLNEAIGSGAAADTFDSVKTAVYALAAAFTTLKVVRSDTLRQTKEATANWIQYRDAVSSGKAVVLGSAEAHRQQWAAMVEALKAENDVAIAAEAEAAAQLKSAQAKLQNAATSRQVVQATRQETAAQSALAQAQERTRITGALLSGAEEKLADATQKAAAANTVWARASSVMAAGATKVATAFKSLWAAMGGGVGVALTAIVTGLTYLSTRQTDAERTTKALQDAQEAYSRATKGAVDDTGKLTRALSTLEQTQLELAQRKLEAAQKTQIKAISDALTEAMEKTKTAAERMAADADAIPGLLESERERLKEPIPPEFEQKLNAVLTLLKNGQPDAKAFGDALSGLRKELADAGPAASSLVAAIDKIISGEKNAIDTFLEINESYKRNKEILESTSGAYKETANASTEYADALDLIGKAQQVEIKDAKDAVEWLLKRTQGSKTMKEATEANARDADELALAKLREAEAVAQGTFMIAASTAAIAENQEAANAAIDDALKNWEAATQARQQFEKAINEIHEKPLSGSKGRGGGGGASQIDSARESIKRLQEEVARLNGTMSKEGGALAKKIAEIEKLGKQAKMSGAEIKKLQEDYSAAFRADALKEFDKAVLQIEGDTQKLRALEIDETMKNWGLRFVDMGMSAEEAAPHLERLKAALENQESYKDLQTAADFYKDLEQLSGEYGQSIEYQNQLIEKQAQLWIQAGIPLEDVEKRVQLMRQDLSRDMFSGLVRGARKFGSEYGDMASQVEGFTTQMGSHISNTLADAFMKGKFSAQDFFSSLISMAAQAASNAFIGQIFSGLGGMVGGLFGSPTSGFSGTANNFSSNASFVGPMIPSGVYHAGGTAGQQGTEKRALPYSAFANAPRFHSGGGYFGSDEFPAILLRGERVLNRRETAAYNAGQAAALPAGKQDVTVNVINQTGQNVEAQTEARQDANGALNLDIILRQVDSGMASLARQGKSSFGAYMQKAYGLDRASTIMNQRGRA